MGTTNNIEFGNLEIREFGSLSNSMQLGPAETLVFTGDQEIKRSGAIISSDKKTRMSPDLLALL
jgi:hypothetical protein